MSEKMLAHVDSLKDLTFDQRLVMYVLADHADDNGEVALTPRQIAREMPKWTKRALRRCSRKEK